MYYSKISIKLNKPLSKPSKPTVFTYQAKQASFRCEKFQASKLRLSGLACLLNSKSVRNTYTPSSSDSHPPPLQPLPAINTRDQIFDTVTRIDRVMGHDYHITSIQRGGAYANQGCLRRNGCWFLEVGIEIKILQRVQGFPVS